MVSHTTHKSHVKFISFNAIIFPEVIAEMKQISFIEQRDAPLVKIARNSK